MGHSTVDVGRQFERWCELMTFAGARSHEEFAKIVLNWFESCPLIKQIKYGKEKKCESDLLVMKSVFPSEEIMKNDQSSSASSQQPTILRSETLRMPADVTAKSTNASSSSSSIITSQCQTAPLIKIKSEPQENVDTFQTENQDLTNSSEQPFPVMVMAIPSCEGAAGSDSHVVVTYVNQEAENAEELSTDLVLENRQNSVQGLIVPEGMDVVDIGNIPFDVSANIQSIKKSTAMKRKQECEKGHHCGVCGIVFTNPSNLRRHIRRHEINGIDCDVCDQTFTDIIVLNQHIQQTHQGMFFRCKFCSKLFQTRYGLKMHENRHQGKLRHFCSVCGQGFLYPSEFDAHCNEHQEYRAHKCNNCGKAFFRSSGLNKHKKTCIPEHKPFECDVCFKKFAAKRYMTEHRKTHTNRDRYHCGKCGMLFTFRASLSKHSAKCSVG